MAVSASDRRCHNGGPFAGTETVMKNTLLAAVATLALFAALPSPVVLAAGQDTTAPDPAKDPMLLSGGFLSGHPDLRYRMHGQAEIEKGRLDDAFSFFRRAAWYGDKASQGMVAEMLWNGQGTARDRALAYAWMDLAAERGYYGFALLRERYWDALTEEERARALELGTEVYAQYGDAAAEPRLATALRRARRSGTGSRTGFTGNVKINVPGPGGEHITIDGAKFYDDRYWDPKQYRAWQDEVWTHPARVGKVSVGDVEQVRAESRIPATAPQQDAEEPRTPERDGGEILDR